MKYIIATVLLSIAIVGGISSVQALDVVFNLHDDFTIRDSVDVVRQITGVTQVAGDNTVISDAELAAFIGRGDSTPVDSNAAPSMQGQRGVQGDKAMKIVGAEGCTVLDQGSQLRLLNCDRKTMDSKVFMFYKGHMLTTQNFPTGELPNEFYVQIPREVSNNEPVLVDIKIVNHNGYLFEYATWKTPIGPAN